MIKEIPTKELANCIGKTEGFASQIKNGRRRLPPKYLVKVSERFGIPLKDLCEMNLVQSQPLAK